MKIFISYRRAEDNKSYIVGNIHERLSKTFGKENVFRDTYDIPGGSEWRQVLDRELNTCKVMIVVIGPDWATLAYPNGEKRLFDPQDVTRWEVETGLRRSREENISLIPVLVLGSQIPKIEELPETLHEILKKQGVSLRNYPDFDSDFEKLMRDIKNSQGYHPVENPKYFEPKTVYIAEGPFLMGSSPGEEIPDYEQPQHEVILPAFCIGIHPITNYEYSLFISDTRVQVSPIMGWDGQIFPPGMDKQPVTGVTWYEALAYCQWLSEKTERKYSLPNEAQWEKACRGGSNYLYPWGNEFDPQRSNHGCPTVAEVKAYPAQNEFGCFDLVGNVLQWTCTLWGQDRFVPDNLYRYPWMDDGRNNLDANRELRRIVRGSTMREDIRSHQCSVRRSEHPEQRGFRGARISFRVAMDIE